MTLGVAGKAPDSAYIVTVTDMRISLGDEVPGVDIGRAKMTRLDQYWGFLFSANDTAHIDPISLRARAKLMEIPGRHTLAQATDAVVNAYQAVRSDAVFYQCLKQYGYTSMEDFRTKGVGDFGAEVFRDILQEITTYKLGVDLLLYGFDENGLAHFVDIINPGKPLNRDDMTYWATGSGFSMAMATLNSRSTIPYTPESMVYRCCEAKFVSEFGPVGTATAAMVWYPDGTHAVLMLPTLEKLRAAYERARYDPIPDEANETIASTLKLQEERRRDEVERRASRETSGGGNETS